MVLKRLLGTADISEIIKKPGEDWSDKERQKIIRWLFEDQQLLYLLHFCLDHLGTLATVEDSEDVWSMFCVNRLNGVITSYDPSKGRIFWSYLLFCLERECNHYKWKLIKEETRKVPLESQISTEEGELEIVILPAHIEDPIAGLEHHDFIQRLNHCLSKLPLRWKKAFQLTILQEMSYEQASSVLEERTATIRVHICRAKKSLRECLAVQGWAA